ncbi:hypothetical protein CCR97_08790 [Rhodoplanes elegans]|uniref:MAPEG family protein n=1 Tax=Rhodoplanes elegans TaxID=29408 RepID=A0A327K6I2_9BRAD|nr:MAPEG family protein [Rhodoplanes elegans]MBK5958306.1 hypothetical protein [Rhodoplanes elegans]RAI32992.1 hypothetical protein CH338_23295 [Rhodoplanes elegans]
MALDAEQRGVARGMAAGALFSAVVVGAGLMLPPIALPAADTTAYRLAFALRCDLVVALWLIATIAAVANGRFFSARDIAGSAFAPPSERIAIPRAVLQNTLEQAVVAIAAHLALATVLPFRALGLIPLLVVLFSVGRAAFWAGYGRGAHARAFGFATTFYPTIFAALLALGLSVGPNVLP